MSATSPDVVLAEGQVGGAVATADGGYAAFRMDKTRALVQQNAHGWYHEAAARGNLFIASIGAAGVAPGTALSTSPAFTLWNPSNSGVLVSILQVFVGYVSGTLGAGSFVHAQNASQVAAPTGGTELTPVCALLNNTRGSARAFTGSTISATSTLLRPSISVGAALASSVAFPSVAYDEVGGGIVIPAGVAYCYQGIAAGGSTPLVMIGCIYEEITLPA
jgi:hypothetical protein